MRGGLKHVPMSGYGGLLQPVGEPLSIWTLPISEVMQECGSLHGFKAYLGSGPAVLELFSSLTVHTVQPSEAMWVAPGQLALVCFFHMGDVACEDGAAASFYFWPLLSKKLIGDLDPEVRQALDDATKTHMSRVAKVPVWAGFARTFAKLVPCA